MKHAELELGVPGAGYSADTKAVDDVAPCFSRRSRVPAEARHYAYSAGTNFRAAPLMQ